MSNSNDLARLISTLFAAPSFEEQGMTVDEALMILGLINEPFYDRLRGAEQHDIARLEAIAGLALPARYTEFLGLAGGSLGSLQIQDSNQRWDFQPAIVASVLEAKPIKVLDAYRRSKHLAVVFVGKCLMYEYYGIDDSCLFLESATGWLFPDDYDRGHRVYDCIQAFLLEWGHNLLDPRMAASAGHIQALYTKIPPGLVAQVHEIVASMQGSKLPRYVGGLLGIYSLYDSAILIKASPTGYPKTTTTELWIYGGCRHGVDPKTCAANAVLRRLEALGNMRVYGINGATTFGAPR